MPVEPPPSPPSAAAAEPSEDPWPPAQPSSISTLSVCEALCAHTGIVASAVRPEDDCPVAAITHSLVTSSTIDNVLPMLTHSLAIAHPVVNVGTALLFRMRHPALPDAGAACWSDERTDRHQGSPLWTSS